MIHENDIKMFAKLPQFFVFFFWRCMIYIFPFNYLLLLFRDVKILVDCYERTKETKLFMRLKWGLPIFIALHIYELVLSCAPRLHLFVALNGIYHNTHSPRLPFTMLL